MLQNEIHTLQSNYQRMGIELQNQEVGQVSKNQEIKTMTKKLESANFQL